MNSKERLEEIKKHRNEADNSTDEYEFEKINFYNLHVDWLIEQAERGIEYDRYLISLEDNKHYVIGLEKQNKRYREAIEVAIHNIAASENLGVKFALGILEQALDGEE